MTDTQQDINARLLVNATRDDVINRSPNARLVFDTAVAAAVMAAGDDPIEYASGQFQEVMKDFAGFLVAFTPRVVIATAPYFGPASYESRTPTIDAPEIQVFSRDTLQKMHMVPTRPFFAPDIRQEEWLRVTLVYPDRRIQLPYGNGTHIRDHEQLISFLPSLINDLPRGF